MGKAELGKLGVAVFHDHQGRNYNCDLDHPVGSGAQGMVLHAHDIYSAVKIEIADKKPKTDADAITAYGNKINTLRRLPVPAAAHISMPVALLKDVAGYAMRFLEGNKPLGKFLPRWDPDILRTDFIPEWIKQISNEENFVKYLAFYARSGGLRKRLQILLQLADTLSSLHGEGLLFGDLSPNNVQISGSGDVWLIDVDNINYDGQSHSHIGTPGYGPPETMRGDMPISIAGDAYSFAVLAFETLTMDHPFLSGPAVEDADIDSNAEEKAQQGLIPWLYDPEDDTNRVCGDLHQYTLTMPLFRLFSAMFGEGRNQPNKRPFVWMFRGALAKALDMTVHCPSCGMDTIRSEHPVESCPYCDSPYPPLFTATAGDRVVFVHELDDKPFYLPMRIFEPCGPGGDGQALQVKKSASSTQFIHVQKMEDRIVLGDDQSAGILEVDAGAGQTTARVKDGPQVMLQWERS